MPTLLKRIIFIAILLGIVYGIYRLVDKQGAKKLKDNVVTTTQETVKSFGFDKKDVEEIFNPVVDESSLGYESKVVEDKSNIVSEKNIIIVDPEIKQPIINKTKTTIKKNINQNSSNILFQLFK